MKTDNLKSTAYLLAIGIFLFGLTVVIGSGGGSDDDRSGESVVYEKIKGLALTDFGNSMLVLTAGTAQDISKKDELWWIEGTPINLYFLSDASYVGYMVTNIDYLGE